MVADYHCDVDDHRCADRHTRDDEIDGGVERRGDREHEGVIGKRNDKAIGIEPDDEAGRGLFISRKRKAGIYRQSAHSERQNAVKEVDRREDRELREHFLGLRRARKIRDRTENVHRRRKPQRDVDKELIPIHRQLAQASAHRGIRRAFVIVEGIVVHLLSP